MSGHLMVPLRVRLFAGEIEVAESQSVDLWQIALRTCVAEMERTERDAALATQPSDSLNSEEKR